MKHTPPKPPPDYNIGGFIQTGQLRVRPGWFGAAIIEEWIEYQDGRREWMKLDRPIVINGDRHAPAQ